MLKLHLNFYESMISRDILKVFKIQSVFDFHHSVTKEVSTVRPRDTRPQAARTLTMHTFE